jgi:FkbH-like protein
MDVNKMPTGTTFNDLKKNLRKDFTGMTPLKLAVMGDSATQLLVQGIRGAGYDQQFDLTIYEAGVGQVDRQALDRGSGLYSFGPEFIVIFESGHELLQKYNKAAPAERAGFADAQLARISRLVCTLQHELQANVIYCNFPEEDDGVFGNFGNKVPSSFIYQQRRLNFLLTEYTAVIPSLFINDICAIQNRIGRERLFSPAMYVNSSMTLSLDAIPAVAQSIVRIVSAVRGKIVKCLILDLDNTVWGGVVGDDGLDSIQIGGLGIGKAFTEFQHWVKKLQRRGIIVCICSKNAPSVAQEPFEKHPDMVLRMNDIALFLANWESKVDNIRHIQRVLNIGFDSMVFLDDNPCERGIVRSSIPDIIVPELPKDPADYLERLYALNLFETASWSSEDAGRTEHYRKELERTEAQESYANAEEFLAGLNMIAEVKPFDSYTIPRVAQLSQRTNQFNVRTIRYTEDDIRRMVDSGRYVTLAGSLADKYGDYGLICAVMLKKRTPSEVFIDSWFMSCRVFNRGMENFMMNAIAEAAGSLGCRTILGEYLPTTKNGIVKDLFADCGFVPNDGLWHLDVSAYRARECFISPQSRRCESNDVALA